MPEGLLVQIFFNVITIMISAGLIYSKLNREIGELKTLLNYHINTEHKK